jgi:hypothetical protein
MQYLVIYTLRGCKINTPKAQVLLSLKSQFRILKFKKTISRL